METPDFTITLPNDFPVKENVVGEAKEFLDEIDMNMSNQGIYYSLGIYPEKTYLINSEPGLGKTFSIEALNNSKNLPLLNKLKILKKKIEETPKNQVQPKIDFSDFNMFLFKYDIGNYGTAYVNMSSRTIQKFFDTAISYSSYNVPVLISIDECDALFTSRKGNVQTHSEDRKVLETLMKNLQVSHDAPNIYVVMMTNLVEQIDEASIRAGRIDRQITFSLPKFQERQNSFDNAIERVNKRAGYSVVRSYNTSILADLSKNFNYADIYQSVENSLRQKARELIRTKEPGIIRAGYIKQGKLEKAVLKHKKEFKTKQEKRRIGFV